MYVNKLQTTGILIANIIQTINHTQKKWKNWHFGFSSREDVTKIWTILYYIYEVEVV